MRFAINSNPPVLYKINPPDDGSGRAGSTPNEIEDVDDFKRDLKVHGGSFTMLASGVNAQAQVRLKDPAKVGLYYWHQDMKNKTETTDDLLLKLYGNEDWHFDPRNSEVYPSVALRFSDTAAVRNSAWNADLFEKMTDKTNPAKWIINYMPRGGVEYLYEATRKYYGEANFKYRADFKTSLKYKDGPNVSTKGSFTWGYKVSFPKERDYHPKLEVYLTAFTE